MDSKTSRKATDDDSKEKQSLLDETSASQKKIKNPKSSRRKLRKNPIVPSQELSDEAVTLLANTYIKKLEQSKEKQTASDWIENLNKCKTLNDLFTISSQLNIYIYGGELNGTTTKGLLKLNPESELISIGKEIIQASSQQLLKKAEALNLKQKNISIINPLLEDLLKYVKNKQTKWFLNDVEFRNLNTLIRDAYELASSNEIDYKYWIIRFTKARHESNGNLELQSVLNRIVIDLSMANIDEKDCPNREVNFLVVTHLNKLYQYAADHQTDPSYALERPLITTVTEELRQCQTLDDLLAISRKLNDTIIHNHREADRESKLIFHLNEIMQAISLQLIQKTEEMLLSHEGPKTPEWRASFALLEYVKKKQAQGFLDYFDNRDSHILIQSAYELLANNNITPETWINQFTFGRNKLDSTSEFQLEGKLILNRILVDFNISRAKDEASKINILKDQLRYQLNLQGIDLTSLDKDDLINVLLSWNSPGMSSSQYRDFLIRKTDALIKTVGFFDVAIHSTQFALKEALVNCLNASTVIPPCQRSQFTCASKGCEQLQTYILNHEKDLPDRKQSIWQSFPSYSKNLKWEIAKLERARSLEFQLANCNSIAKLAELSSEVGRLLSGNVLVNGSLAQGLLAVDPNSKLVAICKTLRQDIHEKIMISIGQELREPKSLFNNKIVSDLYEAIKKDTSWFMNDENAMRLYDAAVFAQQLLKSDMDETQFNAWLKRMRIAHDNLVQADALPAIRNVYDQLANDRPAIEKPNTKPKTVDLAQFEPEVVFVNLEENKKPKLQDPQLTFSAAIYIAKLNNYVLNRKKNPSEEVQKKCGYAITLITGLEECTTPNELADLGSLLDVLIYGGKLNNEIHKGLLKTDPKSELNNIVKEIIQAISEQLIKKTETLCDEKNKNIPAISASLALLKYVKENKNAWFLNDVEIHNLNTLIQDAYKLASTDNIKKYEYWITRFTQFKHGLNNHLELQTVLNRIVIDLRVADLYLSTGPVRDRAVDFLVVTHAAKLDQYEYASENFKWLSTSVTPALRKCKTFEELRAFAMNLQNDIIPEHYKKNPRDIVFIYLNKIVQAISLELIKKIEETLPKKNLQTPALRASSALLKFVKKQQAQGYSNQNNIDILNTLIRFSYELATPRNTTFKERIERIETSRIMKTDEMGREFIPVLDHILIDFKMTHIAQNDADKIRLLREELIYQLKLENIDVSELNKDDPANVLLFPSETMSSSQYRDFLIRKKDALVQAPGLFDQLRYAGLKNALINCLNASHGTIPPYPRSKFTSASKGGKELQAYVLKHETGMRAVQRNIWGFFNSGSERLQYKIAKLERARSLEFQLANCNNAEKLGEFSYQIGQLLSGNVIKQEGGSTQGLLVDSDSDLVAICKTIRQDIHEEIMVSIKQEVLTNGGMILDLYDAIKKDNSWFMNDENAMRLYDAGIFAQQLLKDMNVKQAAILLERMIVAHNNLVKTDTLPAIRNVYDGIINQLSEDFQQYLPAGSSPMREIMERRIQAYQPVANNRPGK